MRGIDGWLSLIMKERCTHWKDFVERLMNEENVWEHYVEVDMVEDPVVCVNGDEAVQARKEMKTGGSPEP